VALERLTVRGLLDDTAFARSFAETRTARGRGPARIRRDLLAMGVPEEVVRAVVATVWSSDDDVADRALALARSRAVRLAGLPRQTQRRRLLAFLSRRGFTGLAAGRAISQVVR
jgi:regulatory protein